MSSEGCEGDLKVKVGLQHGAVHYCLLLSPVSRGVVYIPNCCMHYISPYGTNNGAVWQTGRRVAEWRVSILDKGLKLNSGRSKVMVGSSGGKMIVNSGKWPCAWFCCLLLRPMGGKGSHFSVQLFGELPVPPHTTGVLETLNFSSFYIILVF